MYVYTVQEIFVKRIEKKASCLYSPLIESRDTYTSIIFNHIKKIMDIQTNKS